MKLKETDSYLDKLLNSVCIAQSNWENRDDSSKNNINVDPIDSYNISEIKNKVKDINNETKSLSKKIDEFNNIKSQCLEQQRLLLTKIRKTKAIKDKINQILFGRHSYVNITLNEIFT